MVASGSAAYFLEVNALFEELDFRPTPIGDLILRRRRMAMLDNLIVYEVLLGNAFLMSSLFHEVEEALADLGLAAVAGEKLDVVVGGLGLGYTAVAALRDPRVAELVVVDVMSPVIEWHEKGMVPLGKTLTDDTRCRLVQGDFFALAATPEVGFDPARPGRKFHAVLLDIDHSPENLLDEGNGAFYKAEGLRLLASQLLPGGVFALWSDDAPDEKFMSRLAEVFVTPEAHVVRFFNPLLDRESASTVYVARNGAAGSGLES
jgi:spermidine synthase